MLTGTFFLILLILSTSFLSFSLSPLTKGLVPQGTTHAITLKTRDGLTRKGILTTRQNAKGNIILCHPATYDKSFFDPFLPMFDDYNCLRFDFRRHGELSEKQYTTLGVKEIFEIEAAVEHLNSRVETRNLPLFGFGISMGAVILIEAQSKHHYFDGLILQAPFESLRQQACRSFSFFRIPLMSTLVYFYPFYLYAKKWYRVKVNRINPATSMKRIASPVFLIHAQDDPTIGFDAFETFKQAGKNCIVKTWTPKTGKHTELFATHPAAYTKKCKKFLTSLTSSKYDVKNRQSFAVCPPYRSNPNEKKVFHGSI